MDTGKEGRSKKVVGLFLAAALTLTPGCSMNPFDWGRDNRSCTDANRDGYCDEDGRSVNRSTHMGYWGTGRSWWGSGSTSGPAASGGVSHGVSSGSPGGIGSSSRSGGGSSGGSSGG